MNQEVKDWIIRFFESKKNGIPGATEKDKLMVDYFSAGLLDSLDVVNLVVSIEQNFKITLGPREMQDRRFCAIGGLAEIVSDLMNNK
ncbi:hypothetical protein JW926_14030 [Candidatus Sumerlaeota bacterium]|nr:hypothetical protein [Candidatus Sumerlaeota bacterium]